MSADNHGRMLEVAARLDRLVPKRGAKLCVRYNLKPFAIVLTGNKRGFLRFGIELLKAANAPVSQMPLPTAARLQTDLSYLSFEGHQSITFLERIEAEDLDSALSGPLLDEAQVSAAVAELERLIDKAGARVALGSGYTHVPLAAHTLRATKAGFLCLGLEMLRAASAPLSEKVSDRLDVDLSYLTPDEGSIIELRRREDLGKREELPDEKRVPWISAIIAVSGIVMFTIAGALTIVGLITVIGWIMRRFF
ncbi:MAG TPA: hypothetical protein VGP72_33475 [Planctomycetota bacterium]|jgi:hypothetical protein